MHVKWSKNKSNEDNTSIGFYHVRFYEHKRLRNLGDLTRRVHRPFSISGLLSFRIKRLIDPFKVRNFVQSIRLDEKKTPNPSKNVNRGRSPENRPVYHGTVAKPVYGANRDVLSARVVHVLCAELP